MPQHTQFRDWPVGQWVLLARNRFAINQTHMQRTAAKPCGAWEFVSSDVQTAAVFQTSIAHYGASDRRSHCRLVGCGVYMIDEGSSRAMNPKRSGWKRFPLIDSEHWSIAVVHICCPSSFRICSQREQMARPVPRAQTLQKRCPDMLRSVYDQGKE